MIKRNEVLIIGIDHGYGYIKTANTLTESGLEELYIEPPFNEDILKFNGRVFSIGQTRKVYLADKTKTEDYYLLTLAAIAKEMKLKKLSRASNVVLAVGLPYSFFTSQRDEFKRYLLRERRPEFEFEGKKYSITLKDVKVYPQGIPYVYEFAKDTSDEISIVDIGSRTIDVLTFSSGRPIYDKCFSLDNEGTLDVMGSIKNYYLSKKQENISEREIQKVMMGKSANIPQEDVKLIKTMLKKHVSDILVHLSARTINGKIIFCGGGCVMVENYAKELPFGSIIKEDISFNASGYEKLTSLNTK